MADTAKNKRRTGRPSKQNAEEMSVNIIEVATQLFAKQGFAATSMEQVAAACGSGKDTIYRRFPSKVVLFQTVVSRMQQRTLAWLEQEIDKTDDEGDALTRLKQIARWFLSVNLEDEMVAFKRVAVSESVVFGDDKSAQNTADPIMNCLVDLVSEAQTLGQLSANQPSSVLAEHLLHAIVFGPSNDAMLGFQPFADEAEQEAYFERAWQLFLYGAAKH